MKTYRSTLVLLAVLAVLGAVVYAVEFRETDNAAAPADDLQIWSVAEADIAAIMVVDAGTSVNLAKREGDVWVVTGEGDIPADEWKMSSVVGQSAQPHADRVVSETIDDPAAFGLEPVQSSLRLSLASGEEKELALGSRNPLGTGYYARRTGEARLYLVSTSFVSTLKSLVSQPTPATPAPVSTPAFERTPAATATAEPRG